jgi:crossover junction endodeoxyribonuclease RusA
VIVLTLPVPPSSNAYWSTRMVKTKATGRLMPMVYVTDEAREYKDRVAWYVRSVGIRAPLAGRVWIDLQLYPNRPQDWAKRAAKDPENWDNTIRRPDLDNCRKVLYDALKGSAFGDDILVFKDSGEVQEPDEWGARVVVTIRSIVRKSPQQKLITEVAANV